MVVKRSVHALLVCSVFVAMGVYGAMHMSLTSEITRFLPEEDTHGLAEAGEALKNSDIVQTWMILVTASSGKTAREATRALTAHVAKLPDVLRVHGVPDEGRERALYDLYFARRFMFASEEPERLLASLEGRGAHDAALRLKRALAQPTATLLRQVAARDPLMLFQQRMSALLATNARVEINEGVLTAGEGRYGVVAFVSASPAFDTSAAARIASSLADWERAMRERFAGLRLEHSAVHRYALDTERKVKADVSRISAVSTLGMLVLFLVVFRSLRAVVALFVPVLCGISAGAFATSVAFPEVHAMSVAFGVSLIGVCVDYSLHMLTYRLSGGDDPKSDGGEGRSTRTAIALGATTTAVGFALLGVAGFPGMTELALFSTVGVASSAVVTIWLLPQVIPSAPSAHVSRWSKRMGAFGAQLQRRSVVAGAALLAVALGAFVVRLEWADPVQSLNARDPSIVAEDERVRHTITRADAGRLVVSFRRRYGAGPRFSTGGQAIACRLGVAGNARGR